MTPYQTLAVTVRLFAIWLLLYACANMLGSYTQANRYGVTLAQMQPLIWSLCMVVVICCLLWMFPLFVAKKILPPAALSMDQAATFDNWFTVGCSLIGLWVLAKAIPALMSYSLTIYLANLSFHEQVLQNTGWLWTVGFNVFQLVMGIWLFLGGKGLKKILAWARYS